MDGAKPFIGAGTPTNIIFPASYWAGFESEIPAPDIEGAKELLAQAGFPDGFDTEIHSWAQYPFLSNAAIVMGRLPRPTRWTAGSPPPRSSSPTRT